MEPQNLHNYRIVRLYTKQIKDSVDGHIFYMGEILMENVRSGELATLRVASEPGGLSVNVEKGRIIINQA